MIKNKQINLSIVGDHIQKIVTREVVVPEEIKDGELLDLSDAIRDGMNKIKEIEGDLIYEKR